MIPPPPARPLALALLLAACAGPPGSAYVDHAGNRSGEGGVGLGTNASGETCTQSQETDGATLYCGTWTRPSGEVRILGPATSASLAAIATESAWRSALDTRFNCGTPVPTSILGGQPAVELTCRRRVGGWPQVALVASVAGRTYAADGIQPAEPVLERSIGVLSGTVSPSAAPALPPGQAEALLASRLASEPFGANDIGRFQALMQAGLRANLAESYVAAEQAYRAALDVQRKALGANDPNTATPMMLVALQLDNQGRSTEADALFARASALAPNASSPTAIARLDHYRALGLIDQDRPAEALPLLEAAEAAYASGLPPDMLATGGTASSTASNVPIEPEQQAALIGVIEARRYQAIALRELGRDREAAREIRAAEALADARGLHQQNLTARLLRTRAGIADRIAPGTGVSDLDLASEQFAAAQPGTRPLAQTLLLRAAQSVAAGDARGAIDFCRQARGLFDELRVGSSSALIAPCLDAYARVAAADPVHRQALLAEMFETSQLVQGSITTRQIALAAARLATGTRDPSVAAAIRRQQDAGLHLADLQRQRDEATAAPPPDLPRRIEQARAELSDADAVLQAAAPNYGQLVQEVATAHEVQSALAPDEAFLSITLTPDAGWVFAIRTDDIEVAPAGAGATRIATLVRGIRKSVEPTEQGLPAFDAAGAREIYDDTIAPVRHTIATAHSLVVVPSGPLLSIPFELLLAGPVDPADPAHAPYLVRQFAISHVPAAANFVSLRRASAAGQAAEPWFGFGDFLPVTLAQAEATFPAAGCRDSARLFAGLPPLPFAQKELAAARVLLGGSPADQLEGTAFTTPDVLHQDLGTFRVLHFATHALLPTDLACEAEPAIVTSAPIGAPNASGALLTASDVMGLHLDADVVIISACNSAGPDGSSAGESLSGLARSFFYAGARATMVTHWSVNDQATAYLVAGTLHRLRVGDPQGIAGALRSAQLSMLDAAGKGMPATVAHPFYWAPFALVGEGRGRTAGASAFAGL